MKSSTQVNAMLSSAPRQPAPLRSRPPVRVSTVCVVDRKADDFDGWESLANSNGLRLALFASAEEALRFSRENPVDLWIINTQLPGLSGYELCSMLKNQSARTTVYLVADEYSVEVEQSAWQSRATLFGCKGAHGGWLECWLHSRGANSAPRQTAEPAGLAELRD